MQRGILIMPNPTRPTSLPTTSMYAFSWLLMLEDLSVVNDVGCCEFEYVLRSIQIWRVAMEIYMFGAWAKCRWSAVQQP